MADILGEISKKTGIGAEQVADVLKSDDAKKIASDLGKKVGIDEATTGQVMDAAAGFLGGAKDKD